MQYTTLSGTQYEGGRFSRIDFSGHGMSESMYLGMKKKHFSFHSVSLLMANKSIRKV